MSIFNRFKLASAALRIAERQITIPPGASPFSESNLVSIILADVAGMNPPHALTREQAMSVPAVAKARSLILGTLGRQPLALYRDDEQLTPPPWLYRSDTAQAPLTRLSWTLDDLLFYGRSLWAVERDSAGMIADAIRLPQDWWDINSDGHVCVSITGTDTKKPVPPDSVILFEGLQEGLLDIASRTLTAAIDLENAWGKRVSSPVPLVELHEAERDSEITEAEAEELVARWETSRQKGGTAFTPYGLQLIEHGDKATDLFIEGRNALRLDVALFTNLPSTLLEGSQATASLTYSTQEGRRNELVDYSLAYWAAPIEARLSQDDVTPPGTRIAFNIEYFSQPTQPAGFPATKD
ncbi:MAG: phage portal protein [Actinomycetaceae bacterium]|nr:phage portal protein [Actinomycetaceae bacterium]MDY5273017.1 phage portal protein [Arcanobacterium sp.]